ncbi:unnamed protein product [Allacma fusca]|uniref:UBC core domain-containing protein n=1 Tax=Allacma fusca TaxID=39272 RepID=A0A8J2JNG3_9HEXA|nr:unnamed protein product [Allacma fusca]
MMEDVKELKSDESPFMVKGGKTIRKILLHDKLNVIFVGTEDREIFVLDPTLGDVIYHTSYNNSNDSIADEDSEADWDFTVGTEKIIVVNKDTVGIRSEYKGIVLLDTVLQTSISNSSDTVLIELNVTEAESLCHSLAAVDVANESDTLEVEKQLKAVVSKESDLGTLSVKKEKWSTVKLELPHSVLKSTFHSMVTELWKKNAYIPQLSIASSILERLNMLLPPGKVDTDLPLDKSQMFSESSRLQTFVNWPHTDYKWALPEKMAQAGFYHNPGSNGDDRALCFTCNVCLVSWEPTDEPWSEHERHSPFCPFVRGEHTHNVPLYLSYATAPAFTISKSLGTPILGKSSYSNAAVIAYSQGLVVVWDIAKQAKEAVQFPVTYKDFLTAESIYSDVDMKPKEAWVMDVTDNSGLTPLHECPLDSEIHLTCTAVIGPSVSNSKKPPPSVLVAGTITKKDQQPTPFFFVYGLGANTVTEECKDVSVEILIPGNCSGTKQESQVDDEDLFVSYMSESDMMSDSVSIFSDMNMSDSSGTLILDIVSDNITAPAVPVKKKATVKKPPMPAPTSTKTIKVTPVSQPPVSLIQRLTLPSEMKHCYNIRHLIPTSDGSQVIVVTECSNLQLSETSPPGSIIIYNVKQSNTVQLDPLPVTLKNLELSEIIVDLCLIPPDVLETPSLASVHKQGHVVVYSLNGLTPLYRIMSESTITSISYCTSLERLCCGTNQGSIELYPLNNQTEEEKPMLPKQTNANSEAHKLVSLRPQNLSTMKQLLQLTLFENLKPCFTANVPSCWVKIIQAQKERKHPQHLQHHENELSTSTLSWRLQRNKNSKKEHLFELTLPKSTLVGHMDLKFILQMGCMSLPTIEVTLYKATKSNKRGAEVDKAIDFGTLKLKTASNEFLKSINAEIVCGPLDLGSHVDLSGQGGNIVMTSPSIMLTKGRNFYLHIKAKNIGKSSEGKKKPETCAPAGSSRSKSSSSAFTKMKFHDPPTMFGVNPGNNPFLQQHPIHKMMDGSIPEMDKKKDYGGCDWLNEISITIRQNKASSLLNEDQERRVMLTSTEFVAKLLAIAVFEGDDKSYAAQNAALDLLVWIAAVNLCGPQVGQSSTQLGFINTIQTKLSALILHGILNADRSTSHKSAKLLVLCIDAVENHHPKEAHSGFLPELLDSILDLLPNTITCVSAGSLQWYFLLLNRVRSENLYLTGETLLRLLRSVSQELYKRTDPMHALLRTRFGLYGTPFEPELFEVELPPVTKSYSHPLTYAGMCGGDNPNTTSGAGTFHLWGLKDVDFRDLLVGNPLSMRWGKVGLLSPKQQIQGLLEVEPLHFTCHAASDGTRIEKIDLGLGGTSLSAVPFPQPFEPFTNMPTGEGSKKSEPDKVEQIMMLQKALKMDAPEAFSDFLADFHVMGNKVEYTSYPGGAGGFQFGSPVAADNWNKVGVLTMVMNPGSSSTTAGSSKVYGPFIQPTAYTSAGHPVFSYHANQPHVTTVISKAPTHGSTTTSTTSTTTSSATTATAAPVAATTQAASTSSGATAGTHENEQKDDGLRLLLSPWQQMMYVPPQQALVIDRMHSGARRFVVLDFGAPVLLTDMVIPSCNDLVSLSIDIWVHREETDGQRLIVASDIGMRSLVICDLQPPPVCRYLKITTIGRYGMGTTKCRIPVGMFYGHTVVLPTDLGRASTMANFPPEVTVLSPINIQGHLSVLSSLVEDIGCRYQLACTKLKRLLEPLLKPEISSLDHISFYLPKGKERNKLGLNSHSDQGILLAYQECITLQQQLNVAKNVMKRLQKSLSPFPIAVQQQSSNSGSHNNGSSNSLSEICTDKVHIISEFLIESLLGISFILTSNSGNSGLQQQSPVYTLYKNLDLTMCEDLFKNVCVLENGQCQLSTCTLMLRVCGFQPWWGKFLASTLKSLFSSSNNRIFPQDRVFILLVYLGQKALLSGQNSSVLESAMELLAELLVPIEEQSGFLRSKIDMTLLGWVVMFLCLCLDGVNCALVGEASSSENLKDGKSKRDKDGTKDSVCLSSRWDFIQGESALYRRITNPKSSSSVSGFKRRLQKKIIATKQKLEELDSVAAGLGYNTNNPAAIQGGLGSQLSALGNKIEAIKQKQASIGKSIKLQSSKHFKDLLQIRRTEMLYRKGYLSAKDKDEQPCCSDVEINLNLNPQLCQTVAKGLGLLLLRMDSTCNSDVYLIVCKALARIATACRPAINLSGIFNQDQIVRLVLTAVGSDYVRQRNWSSSWVSHSIMCLIQDILEGERVFPRGKKTNSGGVKNEMMVDEEDDTIKEGVEGSEDMVVDETDACVSNTSEPGVSLESGESDYEDILDSHCEFIFNAQQPEQQTRRCSSSKKSHMKKLSPCVTSISTALDARLENGVESSTELRLRMMAVVDSEVLTQSLKAPIEIPAEIVKNLAGTASRTPTSPDTNPQQGIDSCQLLASCFQHIFEMMSSENCSVSIEKVLQLWISINLEIPGNGLEDAQTVQPSVPLSRESISALMTAFSKNTGIGVQEWGLAFQCLTLVSNQKNSACETGEWFYIMQDKNFPEMILRFISGAGMNLQKTHIVSAGPTVCQQFYNFLTRLRELSHDTPWTSCLKEILLRVLCLFLSGPFLNTDFPLDAFNKFLDRVTCPDLSYENAATVVNIIEQFAQALHLFVFFPTKITIRSNTELKTSSVQPPTTSTPTAAPLAPGTEQQQKGKTLNFEQVMFRLVSFVASCVTLPYKSDSSQADEEVTEFLNNMPVLSRLKVFDSTLTDALSKFGEQKPRTIGDIVLRMEKTMMRILSVLANPNGIHVLVSGDLLSAFNIMETSTPTTVVDAVIHLFCKLNSSVSLPGSTIQPIFRFLSKSPYDDFHCPLIVSETFVLMVLKVISKEEHLREFNDLKCVESVCDKLISSTRKFFSSCPTFVSILTQYIGRTDTNAIFGQKKFGSSEQFELPEGVINVAPLGTITSSNFSAHPSEVLLHATPPHRRARTPVWSYHFLPEETFLELVISLPCAILLKEVQILPHMTTSVSTACPSAVMVEVSRDRSNYTLPMGPPVQCGGLSTINIQLTQPEVAQTVLLRLFKPKDSNNLGLSQIRLLGCTTFSEAALEGLSAVENVRSLEASAHWMYIMDRAISVSIGNDVLHRHIVETAVGIPDMLESCYSMLMAPVASIKAQEVYLPHVSSVLFQFGCLRRDVSETLMSALLGPVQRGFSHGMVANANPQAMGVLSQLHTVVELVFKLCVNVPQFGYDNLVILTQWLDSAADNVNGGTASEVSPGVVPEYVQAVAATLWAIAGAGKTDLTHIVTFQLLEKLFNWTKLLNVKSELKSTLDHVICALCYSHPWLFVYLMYLMGIVQVQEWVEVTEPMVKHLAAWYEEGCLWDRVYAKNLQEIQGLNPGLLMTLGYAAQSPSCANLLLASQFLEGMNATIIEFWNCYTNKWMNVSVAAESFDQKNKVNEGGNIISTPALIGILKFYSQLCSVNIFKTWFGTNGSIFWLPILNLLSTLPGSLKSHFFGSHTYELESVVINFLAKACWSHPDNQNTIAKCLCEIVVKQKVTPHKAVFLHSMSSFCRRLLIQLLLENEKVIVHVKSGSKYPLKNPGGSLPLRERHPSMGVNGGDRIFYMSTHSYVYELLKYIEPFGVTMEKMASSSDPNRFLSMLKKEQGLIEAGLEMIDQMQLSMSANAAFAAKDKRSGLEGKRPFKTATKKLKQEGADIKSKEEVEKPKGPTLILESEEFPEISVPSNLPIATLMAAVRQQRPDLFLDYLVFTIRTEAAPSDTSSAQVSPSSSSGNLEENNLPDISSVAASRKRKDSIPEVFNILPLPSTIEVFSRTGGLGLLAKHLPVVYPETLRQIAVGSKFTGNVGLVTHHVDKDSPVAMSDADWVKIESADDFYDEMMDSMVAASTPIPKRSVAMKQFSATPGIPPHSMAAFGLFLGLPRFSEVLLGERIGAQCMLRLVMGVTDDAEGNDIFGSAVAKTLPTLPFQVLRCLLDVLPVTSKEGQILRRAMTDIKAIHFILACLAVFTHQNCDSSLIPGLQHELVIAATKAQGGYHENKSASTGKSDDKSHVYWAKGTGFGTGSTAQSWDIELAMQKKKQEEENVTCLLHVLSSFIHPRVSRRILTAEAMDEGANNTGYLRNDSVLDMARHVPLYKAVLQFLRALVSSSQLVPLLAPWERKIGTEKESSEQQPISCLLSKMKDVVDNYSKRLTSNTKSKGLKSKSNKTLDDLEDEGLALLIPDIQNTAVLVQKAVTELISKLGPSDVEMLEEELKAVPIYQTLEERYLVEMKKLQFAFFDMITEDEDTGGIRFTVSHHYEGNVRNNWSRSTPARLKRLAQESVTLSTSLPVAYGSTIFVRCDTDRLDIMKVLITGPSGTPYSNGCFEFDVFFPNDYPSSPMMINLETTGRQRIRFNPNLYTDGKVCLSILNTWHGRPEEKWNPQTSSLLPVLVAIQSLILNAEPYYNEPGYEKSRGTEAGERNSREYNAGIEIATVEWAMLDQIRHPSACFKDVIHRHFWLKRAEVLSQCEKWLENLIVTCKNDKRAGKHVTGSSDPVTVFKNNLALLKKELGNMKPPEGLEDFGEYPVAPTSNNHGCMAVFPTSSSTATVKTTEESANEQGPSSVPETNNPPANEISTKMTTALKSDSLKNVDNLKKLLSVNSSELLDVDDDDEDDDGELDEDYVEDEEDEEYTMLMDM